MSIVNEVIPRGHGSIASELITHGWHQGSLRGPDGSVCLAGAALMAADSDKEWYDRAIDVMCLLTRRRSGLGISSFNDTRCRTFDEVLRVAKEADEILAI